MSEAKFTKGEWEVHKYTSTVNGIYRVFAYEVWSGNQYVVNKTEIDYPCEDLKTELLANAHLIAAAPEMYAMLEEVAKELYNLIDEVNDQRLSHVHASSLTQPDLYDSETIHNIQLLLAKARGE